MPAPMGDNNDYLPPLPRLPSVDLSSPENTERKGYALSGKIMLSAIVVLFAVVVFMICLHIYARWYILRARRRHLRRRANLVFYVERDDPNAVIFSSSTTAAARGLDVAVLRSLPVFVYSSKTHPDDSLPECAVCLSEFEENEKGRVLPNCKHSFHTDCIDMWFHSHSTCPLCRSPVEPVPGKFSDVTVSVVEPSDQNEPASSSGFSATCRQEERGSAASSSSLADRRKAFELATTTIEVPRGYEPENDLATSSPASQGFKSPYSRLLSLTRILSMNRKSKAISPSSGIGTSSGTATAPVGLDIECGRDESTQPQTRVETPR